MKALKILFTLLLAVFITVPAMALDQSACGDQFVYHADWNVVCEGRLELQDMGQFVNGVWEWDQAFLDEYNANNYTQNERRVHCYCPA